MKVAIGFLHPGTTSGLWATSMLQLVAQTLATGTHRIAAVAGVPCGPRLTRGRNLLFETWLQMDAEYLFMVDTDLMPPADTLDRLVAHGKDVVGALYFAAGTDLSGRMRALHPCLFRLDGDGIPRSPEDYPLGLVPVDAVGTGCMLVHRRVAEGMERPWFSYQWEGREYGEDVTFCLQARDQGFEVYCDTTLAVDQVKPMAYGEPEYRLLTQRRRTPPTPR